MFYRLTKVARSQQSKRQIQLSPDAKRVYVCQSVYVQKPQPEVSLSLKRSWDLSFQQKMHQEQGKIHLRQRSGRITVFLRPHLSCPGSEDVCSL